jgi:hypothetical protein
MATTIRADVYCDLRLKCTSIKALDGPSRGRVVSKPTCSVVHGVTFRVQPGTLATIRAKHVRAVCAYARGDAREATATEVADFAARGVRVHFNPFRADTFTLDDGTPVLGADVLAIDHKSAYVVGPVLGSGA